MSSISNIVHHAILNKRIDIGAVHDSEDQSDAARCYPGTRDTVIDITMTWIDHGEEPMAWVTGFMGTGKTAILLSIAERCHREGILAASFFSSSSHRRDLRTLIPTILYQLSSNHILASSIGKDLTSFFSKHPDVFEKSFESQADSLLQLFKKPSQSRTNWPKVIVIDGFDQVKVDDDKSESPEHKASKQRQALRALLKLTADKDFPFRVLIGSRQEPAIVDFMKDDATCAAASMVSLNGFLGTAYGNGIELFFDSKFEEARRKPGFPQDRFSMEPSTYGWPPFNERQRNILTFRAAGYFTYASCVARFIENGSQPPQAQLEAVLSQKEQERDFLALLRGTESENPPPPNPFVVLDAMYSSTLNSCPDPLKVATILKLIHTKGKDSSTPAYFWHHFFESSRADHGLANGGLKRLLNPLFGLMSIPPAHDKTAPFAFCHSVSLFEYLDDERRCGKLDVFEDNCQILFAKVYWDIVERKYFSSAPPGDQEALLGHLFNLYPYFADRTIHDAVMRCDSDWWAVRCISLKKRDHIHLAFDTVHCYCPWYWCAPLCSRWRGSILRKCKEAGWTVPDMDSLKAVYENRSSFFRDYSAAFRPPRV